MSQILSIQQKQQEWETLTLASILKERDVKEALKTLENAPNQTEKIVKLKIDLLMGFNKPGDIRENLDDHLFQSVSRGDFPSHVIRQALDWLEPYESSEWAKTRKVQINIALKEQIETQFAKLEEINSRDSCLIGAQMLSLYREELQESYFGDKALRIIERSNDPEEIAFCRVRRKVAEAAEKAIWYYSPARLRAARHPAVRTCLATLESTKEFDLFTILICKIHYAKCYEDPKETIYDSLVRIAETSPKELVVKRLLRAGAVITNTLPLWFDFENTQLLNGLKNGHELYDLERDDVFQGFCYLVSYFLHEIDPIDKKDIVPIAECLFAIGKREPNFFMVALLNFLNRYPTEPAVLAFEAKVLMYLNYKDQAMQGFEEFRKLINK